MPSYPEGGGRFGSVVYRCVNKKKDEKGYFFRAGQCAVLSSLLFLYEKDMFVFFTSLLNRCGKGYLVVTELRKKLQYFPMSTVSVKYTKVAEVLEKCVLIDNLGKGYFLIGHSEKGYQFQNVEHTV